jgi:aspartate/glutamate racemase
VIYDERRGVVQDGSRDAVLAVAYRLLDRGAQGIVLGCTKLGLLVPPGSVERAPLFPTTRLPIEAAPPRSHPLTVLMGRSPAVRRTRAGARSAPPP